MAWSDRTTYQGKAVNKGTLAIIKAANTLVRSSYFGGEKENITLVQGGYNRGGVTASAGTHDGGGAIDITAYNWKNREKVFRLLGVAMWDRPTLPGVWSHHIHGIVDGDGTASAGAKRQVTAYHRRRNGLANNGADKGYKMLVFPLFVDPAKSVGKPGVKYLTKDYTSREQPTTKAKSRGVIKKNTKFTVVAVVNVNGTYWSIDTNGKFVPSSVLATAKPVLPQTEPYDAVWRVTTNGKWGYDSPNGSKRYERSAGYKLHTTKKAKVGSTQWYVTAYGTWYDESNLAPWTETEPLDVYWRVTENGKWGYTGPNGAKRYERAAGYKLHTVEKTTVNGTVWYITSSNTWYDETKLSPWTDTAPLDAYWRVIVDSKWGYTGPGGAKRYERAKNYKLHTVEKTVVNGTTWYVTSSNTWYDSSNIIPWVDDNPIEPVPESKEYVVDADPFLWGLAKPGSGNEKKVQRPDKSTFKSKARTTLSNKEVWIQGTDGFWSHSGYLIEVPSEPQPVADSKTYKVKATGGLYGLAKPGSGNDKKILRKDGSTFVAKARIKLENDETWIQGTDGYWSHAGYLTEYVPVKSLSLHVGTINVIRWRLGPKAEKKGLDYKDRVPGFAKMRKSMGVSLFGTVESGQYKDADAISKAIGSNWKNILHGDDAGDLTQAVHWDSNKRKMLDEGKYETYNTHHNWATWVLLQDISTGVIFMFVEYHAEYRTRGTKATGVTEYDKIREKQTRILIEKAEKLAKEFATKHKVKNIPIVFAGDFNQDKDDFYDGPGKAMKAAGYEDTEALATSKSGPDSTYPNISPHPPSHRRFDRIFVKNGTKVGAMITVVGPPYTDHNGVGVLITLTN